LDPVRRWRRVRAGGRDRHCNGAASCPRAGRARGADDLQVAGPGHGAGAALIRTGPKTGLLGGSFNPAHGAHRGISLAVLKALALDEVWWLVSPGNPLKDAAGMAPLAARFGSAVRQAR